MLLTVRDDPERPPDLFSGRRSSTLIQTWQYRLHVDLVRSAAKVKSPLDLCLVGVPHRLALVDLADAITPVVAKPERPRSQTAPASP